MAEELAVKLAEEEPKPEGSCEGTCEVQSVQTTAPEEKPEESVEKPVDKAEETKESPLTKLLKAIKEKNATKTQEKTARIVLKDKSFRHKFQVNINNTEAVETLGEVVIAVYTLVERDEPGKRKVSLEDVIRKGDECPCAKHTAFKAAALYIQSGWIGRA